MEELRILDQAAEKLFDRVLQSMNGKFSIESKDAALGVKLLSQFDQLRGYERLYVHKVTELNSGAASFLLLLAEKHTRLVKQLRSGLRYEEDVEEIEPLLLFTLSHDIGKVLIRKETLGDRIADIFNREDIDFADFPTFSRKYFVVGDKPDLVRAYFPKRLIQALEQTDEMVVEINGRLGLARTEKNLSEALLLQLIHIGSEITQF